MRRIPAVAITLAILLVACGEEPPPGSSQTRPPQPSPTTSTTGPSEDFDGTIHGWRIAPTLVLEAEFGNDVRNLDLDCDAREVAAGTSTELDVDLTYFPESATRVGKPTVVKWVCGSTGLSVYYNYTLKTKPFPVVGEAGELRIDRLVTARRAYSIGTSPAERVQGCTVAGHPAVCFRNETEGQVLILVIEDDTLDPWATILLVDAYGVPFDELVQMIEGIR